MRLRHSNASGRGYRRVAAGTGFSYRDLDGQHAAAGARAGPPRKHRHSAGLDGRVDCTV